MIGGGEGNRVETDAWVSSLQLWTIVPFPLKEESGASRKTENTKVGASKPKGAFLPSSNKYLSACHLLFRAKTVGEVWFQVLGNMG